MLEAFGPEGMLGLDPDFRDDGAKPFGEPVTQAAKATRTDVIMLLFI